LIPSTPKTLRGWKEIGGHINASERSARRWEKTRALPVHRVPGGERDAVFAVTDELNSWLTEAPLAQRVTAASTLGAGEEKSVDPQRLASPKTPRSWAIGGLVGAVAVAVAFLAGYISIAKTPASTIGERQFVLPSGSSQAESGVSTVGRLTLAITNRDGSAARLGIPDRKCGTVQLIEGMWMSLCPKTDSGVMLLDIQRVTTPAGEVAVGKKFTLMLQPNARVAVLKPWAFDIEWISAETGQR